MHLYKFQSLEGDRFRYALDTMINERLYLTKRNEINDPEEGTWNYEDQKDGKYLGLAEKLAEKIDSIRFSSFTSDCDDALLWAHYAGGYKGIAFEYDLDENNHDIREMNYDNIPELSSDEMKKIVDSEIDPMDVGLLTTKAPCWCYEKEYRLFKDCKEDAPYVYAKPKRVIFGAWESQSMHLCKKIARKYQIEVEYLRKKQGEYYVPKTE